MSINENDHQPGTPGMQGGGQTNTRPSIDTNSDTMFGGGSQNNNQHTGHGDQASENPFQNNTGPQPSDLFSFNSQGNRFSILPETMGSDYTRAFAKTAGEIVKDVKEVDITIIDNETTPNTAYSLAVVTLNKSETVYFYTLLLAKTGEINSNLLVTDNTNTIIVPSDAFDGVLRETVSNHMAAKYPGKKLVLAGETVVDAEVPPDDKNIVYGLIANASRACATVFEMSKPNFQDMTLSPEVMGNNKLSIEIAVAKQTIMDETTLPRRLDYSADLAVSAYVDQRQVRSLNLQESKRRIIRTGGLVDVVPYTERNQMYGQRIMFTPNIVVNHIKGEFLTPSSCVLALVVASSVRTNNLWMEMMKPQEGDEIHDLGALNYLANLEGNETGMGEKLDFSNSSTMEINSTLARMFSQGVSISLDVDISGASSWYMDFFRKNNNLILKAANCLTGGRMQYQGGVVATIKQIPKGYWVDNNGTRRDIREVDFLAILNGFDGDMSVVTDWVVSGTSQGYNKMPEIIRRLFPSAVITGWTHRVTFNHMFIQELERYVSESGFFANLNAPSVVQGFTDWSQSTAAISDAWVSVNPSFIRSSGPGGYGPAYGGSPSGRGWW